MFDEVSRQIDVDTIRHIFTYEKLKKEINPKKICIIGDGKCNGILGAHLTFPEAIIFSVNLSETLINDYIILNDLNIDIKNSIHLITNINDKLNHNKLVDYCLTDDMDVFPCGSLKVARFFKFNDIQKSICQNWKTCNFKALLLEKVTDIQYGFMFC